MLSKINGSPIQLQPLNEQAADKNARHKGLHQVKKAVDKDGNIFVVKSYDFSYSRFRPIKPEEKEELIAKEIVASHILADDFKIPAVTYSQGLIEHANGKTEKTIVSKFVPGLSTLWETPVKKIQNPDEAVKQCIVRGWMGDKDIIVNNSNIWITREGKAIAGDFGNAFRKKIAVNFGKRKGKFEIPKANLKVMRAFATCANVNPISEKIKNLSDDQIKVMVHKAGSQHVQGWNQNLEDKLTGILIYNRDQLRKRNPFEDFFTGSHLFLHPSSIKFLSLLEKGIQPFGKAMEKVVSKMIKSGSRHAAPLPSNFSKTT
jgi:hypothetical protein